MEWRCSHSQTKRDCDFEKRIKGEFPRNTCASRIAILGANVVVCQNGFPAHVSNGSCCKARRNEIIRLRLTVTSRYIVPLPHAFLPPSLMQCILRHTGTIMRGMCKLKIFESLCPCRTVRTSPCQRSQRRMI